MIQQNQQHSELFLNYIKVEQLFQDFLERVLKQLKLPLETKPIGRPKILTEEDAQFLHNILHEMLTQKKYPTLRDLRQLLIENCQKVVSTDTIKNFIDQSADYKLIKGEPMDEKRVNVDQGVIDSYFVNLKNAVDGVPVSLVFNIDEAGEDDYVDTHSFKVIVPASHEGNVISIPVRRETKRATLVNCICADGTRLKPLMIIPRKTVDSHILKRINANNVFIKFQEKGFANTQLIQFWFNEIFFPIVEQRLQEEQARSGYTGKAVLILDGFACHKKALEAFDLEEKRVEVIYLPPHSSHLTQPLDLVIFAAQKKLTTTGRHLNISLSTQADSLRRILNGIEISCTTENIVSAFEAAGIIRNFSKETCDNFNEFMPLARVEKRHARFYKDNSFNYGIDNWRIDL